MFDNFDEEDERPSDETDPSADKVEPSSSADDQPAPEQSNIDPLEELRQNLLAEEQSPQLNQPKPDLLRRMTGTLSPKKVPNKPKEPEQPGFGVRTAGTNKASEDYPQRVPPSIGDMNTEALNPDAVPPAFTTSRWGEPGPFTTGPETQEEAPAFGKPEVEPVPPESKVRPPVQRPLDPLWDGVTSDNDEYQPAYTEEEKAEQAARAADERKRLLPGFERQQQVSRFISYNPKRSLWQRFKELSHVEKVLSIALVLAVLAVIGLIAYLYVESRQPGTIQRILSSSPPAPTAVAGNPVPSSLHLPGGWTFQLGSGVMVDGKWTPTKSEWLVGTEIRRIIAIPWNKQIEAVIHSFVRGDPVTLDMSNGDVLTYQIQSVEAVPDADTSVLYDTRPSLAIILIQPGNPNRWVVIATP